MNNYPDILIKGIEGTPFTELYIDGHKIHGVRAMEFTAKPGEVPNLKLDLIAVNATIDQPIVHIENSNGYKINLEFEDETK